VSIVGFAMHVAALAMLEKRGRLPKSTPVTT
jgi:hypothetical protein